MTSASTDAATDNAAQGMPVSASTPHTSILCLLLIVLALVSYGPISRNRFIAFDDANYIFMNPNIQDGLTWKTVKWSFTTFREGNWHPLTWLSHAFDYEIYGSNPIGHHYTNLLFHSVNAVLLFLLLLGATEARWASWFVAALFALHPINVESVAWAAERKNVLSMFFFLLALIAYDRFARSEMGLDALEPGTVEHRSSHSLLWFGAVMVFFALGLMAKPQIVTLPFVLLLWDYWPLERLKIRNAAVSAEGAVQRPLWPLAWEKWPLFALALADSIVTVIAQRAGNAVRSISQVAVGERVENVFVSYARYLGKAFWPVRLAPLYPHPGNSLTLWQVGGSVALLSVISTFVFYKRERRYLAMGWLWFLGTMIPMIGIITVGEQGMADRYAYLPFIGLFIAVVWGIRDVVLRYEIKPAWIAVPACLILCACGWLTYRQVRYWFNDETLWRYTLSVTEKNYTAHNNLALTLSDAGRFNEAIPEFRAAYSLHQYPAKQLLTLGLYELRMGQFDSALESAKAALAVANDSATRAAALEEVGRALLSLRRFDEADEKYQEALKLNPDDPDALVNVALLALHSGNVKLAVDDLSRAVKLDARDVNFLLLAQALIYDGQFAEADRAQEQARKSSANFNDSQQAVATFMGMAGVPYLESPSAKGSGAAGSNRGGSKPLGLRK